MIYIYIYIIVQYGTRDSFLVPYAGAFESFSTPLATLGTEGMCVDGI